MLLLHMQIRRYFNKICDKVDLYICVLSDMRKFGDRRGRDRMVVGFTTTCAIR